MGNVNYKIAGNADDAVKAVDRLRAQFEKLEEKLKNQAKFSRQAKAEGAGYLGSMQTMAMNAVTSIASVQAAWGLASGALRSYADANQRMQDKRQGVAASARETEVKIRNQGQLTKEETDQALRNVDIQAGAIPVGTIADARRITEEALSQGFDKQEVINGEMLKAFLGLKAATNQYGQGAEDSKMLVAALATSLRNTEGRQPGLAISAAEIEEFGRAFQALTLTGSIQLQDAIPFARIQSILTARGIDKDTQFAAFSQAVDAFGSGDVAATYLQQASAYLGRAGSEKMQKKLAKLGVDIDTTQFDLIGEDFVGALRNLDTALADLSPRKKMDVIDALFGTKAQAGALTLMGKADQVEEDRQKIAKARESGAYEESIRLFRTSDQGTAGATAVQAEAESIKGLKSQHNLTYEDVNNIIDTAYSRISSESTIQALDFSANRFWQDRKKGMLGDSMTPEDYLQQLRERQAGSTLGGRASAIFEKVVDENDPRTIQMNAINDQLRSELQGKAGPVPVALPENIQVNDPNLQTSVDKMNGTMESILAVLNSGPDRQRVVKLPRTQGTA